jgi:5-methyltetrahydrofolate--homocysteine methyltransferase
VEVDGEKHNLAETILYDKDKDEYLKNLGLRVLRFTNEQVLTNIGAVLYETKKKLESGIDT